MLYSSTARAISMSIIEHHSFTKTNCVDYAKKSVMPSGSLNLKITFFENDEYKNLSDDYKNVVFNNTLCEFEFIVDLENSQKKFELNKIYTFKIFEKTYMEGTDFFGILLQKLRTEKISANKQRYFFYGVKSLPQSIDSLQIFSNYRPKVFVIIGQNKNLLKKCFCQKEENELKEEYSINDYDYFEINKYLERVEGTEKDGSLIKMSPEII